MPTLDSIDMKGLKLTSEELSEALEVDENEWKAEIPLIEEWFERIGTKLPEEMRTQLAKLKSNFS